jgi:uncharacterized protein involved in outer membrane biogenesis
MKKFFKILGIIIVVLIIAVIATPYLFKDKITELIKTELNKSLNAEVDFAEVDLSIFRAFPDARLEIQGLSVINKAPFAGDTLFYGKEVKLDLPIGDLFNGAGEPIRLNELIINDAVAQFKVDKDGNSSWDVVASDASAKADPTDTTASSGFSLDFKHYEINNAQITYDDAISKNLLMLKNMNHTGNGDFSLKNSTLDTYTEAEVFYSLDSISYLSGQSVKLDADILMDLEAQKYTFQENKAFINDLELKMDGFVDLEENSTLVDLSFITPSSDFKNFFAVIPETYRKNMEGITTTGDFKVNGTIKGVVDETYIPKLNINITSSNASFKYPDLPQKVTDIIIDARIINDTGLVDDTYADIKNVAFTIGGDRLTGGAMIRNLTTNMNVDLNAKGNLNFKNLSQSFPLPDNMKLDGKLALDMAAKFDMESIEKERYERINTRGTIVLTDFLYEGEAFTKPFAISKADIDLTTARIKLKQFNAKTGNTDLQATGTIDNLIGFMLQDQGLKGQFSVTSQLLDASDFMAPATETVATSKGSSTPAKTTTEEAIKIPAFLDANLDFAIGEVLYDGLNLKNVSGAAIIRDETMTLNNVKTDIFGGNIGVNGFFSTKGSTPNFKMLLDMKNLDIAQSFQGFDMFQKFVPIISALQGKINTDMELTGDLTSDLSPIMTSLAGSALAQLLTKDVDISSNPLLSKLNERMDFLDLSKLNLSDITTKLNFQNGAVQVAPFDFKIRDINITAGGSHSLENEMDYTLNLNLPAKYLGKEGASLLSRLEAKEVENMSVPLPVKLSGSMLAPQVNVDIKGAVTTLTNQIVEIQKQKLKDKGKETLTGAVNDALSGKDPLGGIKDILNGGGTKPADTTGTKAPVKKDEEAAKDKVKEAAGGLIKGLFGKKKDTTKSK